VAEAPVKNFKPGQRGESKIKPEVRKLKIKINYSYKAIKINFEPHRHIET